MKMIVIGKNAVILSLNDDGKLPGRLKGRVFRHGLVIGSCRQLPVLLAHFEKEVFFIGRIRDSAKNPGVMNSE